MARFSGYSLRPNVFASHTIGSGARGSYVPRRSATAPDYCGLRGMLPRQPLQFLLADDPGAGKTTWQLMKELIAAAIFGDVLLSALVAWPSSGKIELYRRFHLPVEILAKRQA